METKEKDPEKEVKLTARTKREQEAHEMELASQRGSNLSEAAYTLKNCIQMGEAEEGESWKGSMKPQWSPQQLERLMGKLHDILMQM